MPLFMIKIFLDAFFFLSQPGLILCRPAELNAWENVRQHIWGRPAGAHASQTAFFGPPGGTHASRTTHFGPPGGARASQTTRSSFTFVFRFKTEFG